MNIVIDKLLRCKEKHCGQQYIYSFFWRFLHTALPHAILHFRMRRSLS